MDFKQLLQTHYFQEFERRRELNGNLSISVGLLTIIAAGIASMMKSLRPPFSILEILLSGGLVLTAIALATAIYFAVRAFVGHAYRYVAPMSGVRAWREEAAKRNLSAEQLDAATVAMICDQYLESVETNDAANDRKSGYAHRTSQIAVAAMVLASLSSIPWALIEVSSAQAKEIEADHAKG